MGGVCVADPGVTCGAGTTEMNGECVPDGAASCGPGTVLTGNQCVIDASAPGAVTGLAAAVNGSNVDLSWTAGSNSAGTLVVRLNSGAADAPVQGHTYAVGDMLPGGSKVIAAGAGTTVSDAAAVPGRYSYMAWSINAAGTFGFGREVAAVNPLPAQTGAISVNVAGTAATVTTQPANIALAAANVTYNGSDTATVDVTITNNTAGPIFQPRIIATAPSVGVFASATGSTTTDDPFYEVANGCVLPGQSKTTTLTISGVASTDVITASLQVADVGMIIAGTNGLGGAGGGGGFEIDLPKLHNEYSDSTVIVAGMFSPSGRYYYALSRWSTALSRIDTSSGDVTQVHTAPSGANASGTGIYIGADGFAYIANQYGRHHGDTANSIGVARVDLGSMTPITDTRIFPPAPGQSAVSAYRGHRMAIAYGSFVYFFDTDTMAFVDTDAVTADVQGVDLDGAQVRRLAFSPDGTVLYTNDKATNDIKKVDATFAVSLHHTATSTPLFLHVDPANVMWWGSTSGLTSYNGAAETKVPVYGGEVRTLVELGATSATVIGAGELLTLDLTTGDVTRVTTLPVDSRLGHTASWVK